MVKPQAVKVNKKNNPPLAPTPRSPPSP